MLGRRISLSDNLVGTRETATYERARPIDAERSYPAAKHRTTVLGAAADNIVERSRFVDAGGDTILVAEDWPNELAQAARRISGFAVYDFKVVTLGR